MEARANPVFRARARAKDRSRGGARIDHGEHVSFSRADRVLVSSLARLEPVFLTIDATTKFLLDCWRTGRLLFVVVFSLTIGASEGAPGRGESNVGAGRFNPRLPTSPWPLSAPSTPWSTRGARVNARVADALAVSALRCFRNMSKDRAALFFSRVNERCADRRY